MSFFELDFTGRNSLVRGDDFERIFRWLRDDVAIDLTGWTGTVTLYRAGNDTAIYGPASVTLDDEGTITLFIAREDTAGLPKGDALLHVKLTNTVDRRETKILARLRIL